MAGESGCDEHEGDWETSGRGVTVCAIIGLYMTNVEERLLEDFDLWRIKNKRTRGEEHQ